MKQWMLAVMGVVTATVFSGCGIGPGDLLLNSPGDGQTYVLGQISVIDAQLADPSKFEDTTIEFRSSVPQQFLQCQNSAGTPNARCSSTYFPGMQIQDYMLMQACKNPACSVTVILKHKGVLMDVKTFFVQMPDAQAAPSTNNWF